MDYIINPVWFYVIQIARNLNILFSISFTLSLITLFILCLIYNIVHDEIGDNELKKLHKYIKCSIVIFIVSTICYIAIPTQETIIYMFVAKFATYTNAQITLDGIKSVVDYIVQAIGSL